MTDTEYFTHRATVERELSESAADPRAAAVHAEMAERFEELASAERPRLRIVAGIHSAG